MADSAPAMDIIYMAYICPRTSSNLRELTNIRNVIATSMISIDISIKIIFLLFKTKPKTPIKKSIIDKSTFFYLSNVGY